MVELNDGLLLIAKEAKSVEELQSLAEENGYTLSYEDASHYFQVLNPSEGDISDDELESVAGGGCGESSKKADCSTLMQDGCPTFWNMFG